MKDPKVDKFVSGGIIKRGYWEKHIVMEAMRGVEKYPEAVFLDIGANIGKAKFRLGFGIFSKMMNIVRNVHCNDCSDEEESGGG